MPRNKHVTGLGSIPYTEEEEREADEQDALEKEYEEKFGYIRDRGKAYPAIGDQLDALYHAGVFPKEMADKLKAVKDKHPKG